MSDHWYREIALSAGRLRLCAFSAAAFGWLPTLGEWTAWRGVCGYTLDWFHWSVGYHIDRPMPTWRLALMRRGMARRRGRRTWLSR